MGVVAVKGATRVSSTFLFLMIGFTGLLLSLLLSMLVQPGKASARNELELVSELARSHVTYLSVIRQAMSVQDLAFLESRTDAPAIRRTHKERRQIAMHYVIALRSDFRRLLSLARVIAVMSPEIAASREFERLRLTILFMVRYALVVAGLQLGWLLMPQVGGLIRMVSELAFRMESSMKELGERAMVAVELASTLNRRRLDIA